MVTLDQVQIALKVLSIRIEKDDSLRKLAEKVVKEYLDSNDKK